MSSQDLEGDLIRSKHMQEAAAKCYWESKFVQAEELYQAALAVLETVYVTDNANIATCLQGLGDSYYFQDKFGLALPYYKRLLTARERMVETDATEYVGALFKLAKTYDKLGQFEDAEFHYKKAAAIAQKKLFLGHPLLTSLLEAYGKFLKRFKPGSEHAIEQQATLSRETYIDPEMLVGKMLKGVVPEKSAALTGGTGTKKDKIWLSNSIAEESDHGLVKQLMAIKDSPVKTCALLLSPFVLAFAALIISVVHDVATGDTAQNAMVAPGQVFQTVDGRQRITFTKDGADVESGGLIKHKPFILLSNRWRELLFSFSSGSSEPWTVKTADGLISSNGALLIKANSPLAKIPPIMQTVSEQVYAKLVDKSDNEFNTLTMKLDAYTDPYDSLYTNPVVLIVKPDRETNRAPEVVRKIVRNQVESAVNLYDIPAIKDAMNKTNVEHALKPGSVICLFIYDAMKPQDVQFYVLGIGDNTVLASCKVGTPLYFYGATGVPPRSSCDVQTGSTEPRLILARRSMKTLAEAKTLLGWVLLLLIPFVIATIMVQDQFNAKKVSDRGVQAKIAMLQTTMFIYGPFALAYLAFTIYAIFKAVSDGL